MQFATPADLLERLGAQDPPADPAGLLSAASALVARLTAGAVYATFTDGTAVDPRIRSALRDATLAQAAYWIANDLDPTAGSLAASDAGKVVASKTIKGASISYDAAAAREHAAARSAALVTLCPPSLLTLEAAGLTTGRVW